MRVHGELELHRRNDVEAKSKYADYREDLERDFHSICGYCGKSTKITKNAFEIDHFIPSSIAKDLERDYHNLVYSCYMCNRKKSNKWPTKDRNLHHNGKVGFVDPTSEEYDLHLERLDDGRIRPLTEVGKYMCSQAFQFDIRPMREIWLCSQILLKKEQLLSKSSKLNSTECETYIELDITLTKIFSTLFYKKE